MPPSPDTIHPSDAHKAPNRAGLAAILLVAAAVRAITLVQTARHDPTFGHWLPAQDMAAFDAWARALIQGNFAFDPRPELPYSPAYAAVVAVLYTLFGPQMLPVAIVQSAVGVATVWLVYSITLRVFDRATASVAALGYALYVPAWFYETRLLRASWVSAALIAGAWCLISAPRERNALRLFACGMALGFASALRANNLLVLIGALVLAVAVYRGRARMRALAFMAAGGMIAFAPFAAWRAALPRPAQPPRSVAIVGLVAANVPEAAGLFYHIPVEAEDILTRTSGATSAQALRALGAAIAARPAMWLGTELRRAALFWHGYEPANNVSMAISARFVPMLRSPLVQFWPVGVLGFAGICAAWRRTWASRTATALLACVYGSMLPFMVLARYRFALVPFVLPFAAWSIVHGFGWLRPRPWRQRFAFSGALLAALLATHPRTIDAWVSPEIVAYFENMTRINLAVIYIQRDEPDLAIAEYDDIRANHPDFAPALSQELYLLRTLERDTDLRRVCADAERNRDLPEALRQICADRS